MFVIYHAYIYIYIYRERERDMYCMYVIYIYIHHTIPYHTIPYHTIPYHTIPFDMLTRRCMQIHRADLGRGDGNGAPRGRGAAAGGCRENGKHVGRNYVGRFTSTGCTGMLVQVHGLRH